MDEKVGSHSVESVDKVRIDDGPYKCVGGSVKRDLIDVQLAYAEKSVKLRTGQYYSREMRVSHFCSGKSIEGSTPLFLYRRRVS